MLVVSSSAKEMPLSSVRREIQKNRLGCFDMHDGISKVVSLKI